MEQNNAAAVDVTATVLEATTLLASPSQKGKMDLKTPGANMGLIAKIPVVISYTKVQIYVEHTVKLEEPASDFIDVKQNVYLNSCELMPTEDVKTGKLLINGYVRKNIQYATPKAVGGNAVSGDIRYATVNIPFKCFVKVDYEVVGAPPNAPAQENSTAVNNALLLQPDKQEYGSMGSDRSAKRSVNSEKFGEKNYFELMESNVSQVTTKKDMVTLDTALVDENAFTTFDERMLIDMTLLVLQNQYVQIYPSGQSNNNSAQKGGDGGNKGNNEDKDKKKDTDDKGKKGKKGKKSHS